MDSLQKSCYISILKANPKANELPCFENSENFKETWGCLQKLLKLPGFNELFIKCTPKSRCIKENFNKTVKGNEIEFLEHVMDAAHADDGTYVDEIMSFLKQAVEKLEENTAAD